jgi:hypothetical protein
MKIAFVKKGRASLLQRGQGRSYVVNGERTEIVMSEDTDRNPAPKPTELSPAPMPSSKDQTILA